MPYRKGKYNPTRYTWGFELEVGDVDRRLKIPPELGAWEYAERDIVNQRHPYRHVAADPLGLDPPVGGEVNTVPTHTIEEQLEKVDSLLAWFRSYGQHPTVGCTTHSHVHVHVPELTEDIAALRRLTAYIADNQADTIASCYPFTDDQAMNKLRGVRSYLKYDGGRLMPQWMSRNINVLAQSFKDFIRLQSCGRDGVSRCRPIRYAINTYCLKHTSTIEFRCFRSTLSADELESCFRFVSLFVEAALTNGPSVKSILKDHRFRFPPFRFDLEECKGWLATKWGEGRGKKVRRYIEI